MTKKINTGFTPLEAGFKRIARKSLTGFTFIELLIALTIFSIIATSIYYTLGAGIKVYSRGNSIIKDNQRLRIFFDTISLDMRNTVTYAGMESGWSAERISFPAVIDVSDNNKIDGKLAKVIYYFDDAKGRVTRIYSTLKEGFDEKYAEEEVLLDNLENFTFEYCYETEIPEGGYEWKDKWEPEGEIPRGVKIKLTLKNEVTEIEKSFEKTVFIPESFSEFDLKQAA